MHIKTLNEADLKNKKVLLRVDFNVPIDHFGEVQDDTRIRESLPTIREILRHDATLIIMTHFKRPKGVVVDEMRVNPIAEALAGLLKKHVKKFDKIYSDDIKQQLHKSNPGEIYMLENIRFEPGEESCDENFSKNLASLGDIFINDAFGTAHRKHSSTYGIASHLPSFAGLLLEREIDALNPLLEAPNRPLTIIIGGAKIDTKIALIRNFFDKADNILVGGGLANTFLAAAGYNVAKSLYEPEKLDIARDIMLEAEKHHEKFVLPSDCIVANEIGEDVETLNVPIKDIEGDMRILDIGKQSAQRFAEIIEKSKTIIWNGPLGLYEYKPFQKGSLAVAEMVAHSPGYTVLGGGDTVDCVKRLGFKKDQFSHVSTGGGAMLEFLEGKHLPGVEALLG
ncbi:phosphoglycerate kinase [Patescibacteria group bacterium]|nr:phosphoglycerate kinase [Patescibacteria group bacterium]